MTKVTENVNGGVVDDILYCSVSTDHAHVYIILRCSISTDHTHLFIILHCSVSTDNTHIYIIYPIFFKTGCGTRNAVATRELDAMALAITEVLLYQRSTALETLLY